MTDKDKLKKLLQIAASNGYKLNYYISEYWIKRNYDKQFAIEGLSLCCDLLDEPLNLEFSLSINDIVLDYESDGSISFIDALFIAVTVKFHGTHESMIPFIFRQKYSNKPTSERLDYLFEVYSCLLNS